MSTPTIIRHKSHKNLIATVITTFDYHSNIQSSVHIYQTSENGATVLVRSFGAYYGEADGIDQWDRINLTQWHYTLWMQEVNQGLLRKIGLTSIDLPDFDYRIGYDEGETIEEVVEQVIEWVKAY